jgi:hypothetical protein
MLEEEGRSMSGHHQPVFFGRQQQREVPLFTLADAAGREGGTQKHWQRKDMLLALLHPGGCPQCHRLLALLQERRGELEEQDIALVALAPGRMDDVREGVLLDTGATVASAVARVLGEDADTARLVVATRYLRLTAAFDVHSMDPESLLSEVLEAMWLAQVQCEDCSLPLDWD